MHVFGTKGTGTVLFLELTQLPEYDSSLKFGTKIIVC